MARVFIGLGSNIGDRNRYLSEARDALSMLPDFKIVSASSIDETKPVDCLDQPDFLNQVIMGETILAPHALLHQTTAIELQLGRQRTVRKGPRTIDIDILLYDEVIMQTEDLILPHREIRNRPFIMKHLIELDETLVDPVSGELYREVYRNAQNRKHS